MSNELKPCPFCGNKSIWLEDIDVRGMDRYYAVCVTCGAKSGYEDTPEKATEKWNTRAERGCGEARDEVHIARLSNGFQCDGSVWRCCKCGAFFTNYTDLTDHHKPRFCPNCGTKVVER